MKSDASFFDDESLEHFLVNHWQQRPLLLRGALMDTHTLIDRASLFELSCQDDVESRLVIHDVATDDWQCEFGPFDKQQLAGLPNQNCTLLVQAVDQWSLSIRQVMGLFGFLPKWRLDDVMVSFANLGGGVGPHFDAYDVFLCQTTGQRRWEVGKRLPDSTPLREHDSLKLLERFEVVASYDLDEGDFLYLPAGYAHKGWSLSEECITCSVGFRAPAYAELLSEAVADLVVDWSEDKRFTDTQDSLSAQPGQLNEALQGQLRNFVENLDREELTQTLIKAFAAQVTEPRYPDLIAAPDDDCIERLASRLTNGGLMPVRQHPSSRFAYRLSEPGAELYVDGECFLTTAHLAAAICAQKLENRHFLDTDCQPLIQLLIEQGSLVVEPSVNND